MKFKGTLILSLVFIGVVFYYFLLEVPAEKKKNETKELSEKIMIFHTEDVDEFSVIRKDQTIVVQRKGGNPWQIIQPLQTTADPFATETLLDKLRDARFSRVVEEEPADLSTYGLSDPSLKVSLKIKNQNEIILLIGDKSPIGQSFYIKRDDQKKVLLAQAKDLGPSLFDLRDKTVLSHNTRDVTDVELRRNGSLLRLEKKDSAWGIVGTVTAKGDSKDIEDLLNSVRASRVSSFIEENPSDLALFGLNPPSIQMTIQSGKSDSQSLLIGAQSPGGSYYAKTGKANNVFTLDPGIVAALSKGELDFLDKALLEFKEEDVVELHLAHNGEDIHIQRDNSDQTLWEITQPVKSKGDKSAVKSMLNDLKEARITAYISANSADLKSHGLNPPQKRLTLTSKEKKEIGFKVGEQSNDKKVYYAVREMESTVFALSSETINKVFRSLNDLRNKKLPKGFLFWLFVVMYSFLRFFIEFFREPDSQLGFIVLGLTMGQLLNIIMFIVGMVLLVSIYRIKENKIVLNS